VVTGTISRNSTPETFPPGVDAGQPVAALASESTRKAKLVEAARASRENPKRRARPPQRTLVGFRKASPPRFEPVTVDWPGVSGGHVEGRTPGFFGIRLTCGEAYSNSEVRGSGKGVEETKNQNLSPGGLVSLDGVPLIF
jgi:hypothetical protein